MGAEHPYNQQKRGDTSSGNLPTVVHKIQSEWIFPQRVEKNMGEAFAGVERMILKTFFPRLFFVKSKTLIPIVGTLSTMPVKKSSLRLLNPVTPAK